MVLPMAVTSNNEEIATLELVIDQPIKKLVSLMLKTFRVQMVVHFPVRSFPAALGSDHWRGGNENFEHRVTSKKRPFKPLPLNCPPKALVGTIGHVIGTTIVTTLDKPYLKQLVNSMRTECDRTCCFRI